MKRFIFSKWIYKRRGENYRKVVSFILIFLLMFGAFTGMMNMVVAPIEPDYNIFGAANEGVSPPGLGVADGSEISAWIDGVSYGMATTISGMFDLYIKSDSWGIPNDNIVKDGGFNGDTILYFLNYSPMDYYLNVSHTTSSHQVGRYEDVGVMFFNRTDQAPSLTTLRMLKINEIVLDPGDGMPQYVIIYDPGRDLGMNNITDYYFQKDDNATHTTDGEVFDFLTHESDIIDMYNGYFYINLTGDLELNNSDELKLVWKSPYTPNLDPALTGPGNGTDIVVDRVEWGNYTNYINPLTPPDDRDYDNTTMLDFTDTSSLYGSDASMIRTDDKFSSGYGGNGTDTDDCSVDFKVLGKRTPRPERLSYPVHNVDTDEYFDTIQAAINDPDTQDGHTIEVAAGIYTENVVIHKTINLTGEDKNNTTVDGNGTGYAISVSSDWVNITGFTLTNGSLFSPLLSISGVDHCKVWDNIVRDSEDIGINIVSSSHIDVLNNTLFGNGKYGIFVGASDNVLVDCNDIYDNNNDCIRTAGSSFITISNTTAQTNSAKGIVIGSNSDNCIVENNIIDNSITGLHGVGIIDASNSTFKNNSMDKWGLYFDGSFIYNWNTHTIDNSNTVGGKPICYQKNQVGGSVPADPGQIILGNCTDMTISGQTIDNSCPAIYLGFSNRNNVTDCGLDGGGIDVYRSHYNTFDLVTINNTGRALTLRYSDGNTITNCSILDSDEGVYLHYSCNNTFSKNIVDLHTQHGFKLISHSNENTIYENTISNNPYGIRIYSDSENNTVFWDDFVNNGIQAWDQGKNIWNLSYPSGGNYWSDYNGVDEYKGPGQNITGSDGIGDTNYSIDSDSVDNYPLMHPVGNYTFLREGWNLISISLIQQNESLKKVLEMIDGFYDAVQWYNASDSSDQWKHYQISKPSYLNDLTDINHTMGFWIHITKPGDTIFLYNGTQPTSNQSIPLHPGWNMVGYPSLINRNRTAALNNLAFGVEVDAIWTFDAATQTWEEIGMEDYFERGRGYWIHATKECVWEVPI